MRQAEVFFEPPAVCNGEGFRPSGGRSSRAPSVSFYPLEAPSSGAGDEDSGEDGEASERLHCRDRLREDQASRTRRRRSPRERSPARKRRPAADPSATVEQPLTTGMADPGHGEKGREPANRMRQHRPFADHRDDEQDRRRDQRRLEGHSAPPRPPSAPPGRPKKEAEEDAGGDAEGVAERAGGPELKALRQQGRAADQAEAKARRGRRTSPAAGTGASRTGRPRSARWWRRMSHW